MYNEWLQKNNLEKTSLNFAIVPPATNRIFWSNAPEDVCHDVTLAGDELLGVEWPQIPATVRLLYERTGDRMQMEELHFRKRKMLSVLTIAECIDHKGKYLDDILNGVLSIAEEMFWGVSAHYPNDNRTDLPDGERNTYIDLFSAETGCLLAWTLFLLQDEIARNAKELYCNVLFEIDRRIKKVFLKHYDFWWMGYDKTKRTRLNNWSPWITTNVMAVFLLTEPNKARLCEGIRKCMKIQDAYLRDVPLDGGIDEGITYWNHSAGAVIEGMWLLYRASNGVVNLFNDEQVANMADFPRKMYITENRFVNYADASPKTSLDIFKLWVFGTFTQRKDICAFARTVFNHNPKAYGYGQLHTFLMALPYISSLKETFDMTFTPKDSYISSLQVVNAYQYPESQNGLFLSVKGHHNGASHNHNDVGSFIVYKNGDPMVIDLGAGTYTKKTFSAMRYELENCQSQWHNVPIVNGMGQIIGDGASAKDFSYVSAEDDSVGVSMYLQNAYGEETSLTSFYRQILFERAGYASVLVHDVFAFEKDENILSESIIVLGKVEMNIGDIVVQSKNGVRLHIEYDPVLLTASKEEYTSDKTIMNTWQDSIYRISLKTIVHANKCVMDYKLY